MNLPPKRNGVRINLSSSCFAVFGSAAHLRYEVCIGALQRLRLQDIFGWVYCFVTMGAEGPKEK